MKKSASTRHVMSLFELQQLSDQKDLAFSGQPMFPGHESKEAQKAAKKG